jgi:hypothetical protein
VSDEPKRTFTLTLQTSNDATTIHRVRAALKSLLRRWNLRCTDIAEIPSKPRETSPASPASTNGDKR